MVALTENTECVIPYAQLFRVLTLNPAIGLRHQQRNLLLIRRGVIFGFEGIVERDWGLPGIRLSR
jgi:hypothetical protein